MKILWRFIWNASETLGIPLGKYAPIVFERMLGIKGNKLENL